MHLVALNKLISQNFLNINAKISNGKIYREINSDYKLVQLQFQNKLISRNFLKLFVKEYHHWRFHSFLATVWNNEKFTAMRIKWGQQNSVMSQILRETNYTISIFRQTILPCFHADAISTAIRGGTIGRTF